MPLFNRDDKTTNGLLRLGEFTELAGSITTDDSLSRLLGSQI